MTSETEDWITLHTPELLELGEVISAPRAGMDGDVLCADLATLCGWLARSATLTAEAESIYNFELAEAIKRINAAPELKGIATSLAGKVAAGAVKDISKMYFTAERLNAAIVHAIDSVRTMISFEKAMKYNSDGNNAGGKK